MRDGAGFEAQLCRVVALNSGKFSTSLSLSEDSEREVLSPLESLGVAASLRAEARTWP